MPVNAIDGTLAGEILTGTGRADLIQGAAPGLVAATLPGFTLVATGLGSAVFGTAAPGDAGRLFLVDRTGVVRQVDLTTGSVTPFLDIAAQVSTAGEQGLLGLAFHPRFWETGKFYVFFSDVAGDTVLREYAVDPANQGAALAGSGRDLLTVPQPGTATNHKGGWIGFGQDGLLHLATGDGGGTGDPLGTAQDPNDLLGAILRVDVDRDAFPADPARNYGIPVENPFAEVWAYGLRNPYRDSFDRGTGALWIGDVGQGRREEVNLGAPGANYGWPLFEGDLTYPAGAPAGSLPRGITGPVFAYGRGAGDASVIGGYVHRGPDSGLQGQYVFGDFVSGRVWRLEDGDGAFTRGLLNESTLGRFQLASFAEDAEGRLYAVALDGRLLRLDAGTSAGTGDGADAITAGGGTDRVFAGAGADLVKGGNGDDLLSGMEGADRLLGGAGVDTLTGGADRDMLRGGDGNDMLMGGTGNDTLAGDAGNDLLVGGAGGDVLTGGAGADRFRWTSRVDSPAGGPIDALTDFDAASGDRLDVSALVPGVFAFIGTSGFAPGGPQIRAVPIAAGTRVDVSLDGGPADLIFVVRGADSVGPGDFLL